MTTPQPQTTASLAQLADISEPLQPATFAFTPAISGLLLMLLGAAIFFLLKAYLHWRRFAAKRQALRILEALSTEQDAPARINQLIKQVLQHYQSTHPALSYNSRDWQHWLSEQHSLPLPDLTTLLYGNTPDSKVDSAAREQFYQFARGWLKAYKGKAAINSGPEGTHAGV